MVAQVSPDQTRQLQARTTSVPARAVRRRSLNVGPRERWASVAAGALVSLWATRRRATSSSLALAAAGALLLERGLTGTCRLYRAIGRNTVPGMPRDGWRAFEEARRDLLAEARRSIQRTTTIRRSRLDLGTALRDVSRWPAFADVIASVELRDERHARLRLRSTDGRQVVCELELDEDLPEAALGWRVFNQAGHAVARLAIGFADAPGQRGTEVRVSAVADSDAAPDLVATLLAKLAGEAPDQQVRRILRRFKQLMETGEVVSAAGPSGRRAPDRLLGRALRTRTDAPPRLPRPAPAGLAAPAGAV